MDKVLIDTDVVLDFFFDRAPFADDAATVLSLCELNKIAGYVTPVIYSNVYYLLRQKASHEKVIEKLNQLLLITKVLSMDQETVNQALRSPFTDFEDALQNTAAVQAGYVNLILTRNIKDYKNSTLSVLSPKEYLRLSY
jgi:predicted nucleic acid-binding protein